MARQNIIEEVKDATTPAEMRAELFRLRYYEPLVRRALDVADRDGFSTEDRYVMLAYYAMADRNKFQQLIIDGAMMRPVQYLITTDSDTLEKLKSSCDTKKVDSV